MLCGSLRATTAWREASCEGGTAVAQSTYVPSCVRFRAGVILVFKTTLQQFLQFAPCLCEWFQYIPTTKTKITGSYDVVPYRHPF